MREGGASSTRRQGRLVRVPVGELSELDLPAVCVTTGQDEDVTFRPVRFTWIPRWTWLVLVCSIIPYLIVAALTRKSATGELPFSEDAWRSYRTARRVGASTILLGGVALFGSLFALAKREPALGLGLMLVAVAVPVATYWLYVASRGPRCRRVRDRDVELVLPSEAAAKRFEEHLYPNALDRFAGEATCAHHPDAPTVFRPPDGGSPLRPSFVAALPATKRRLAAQTAFRGRPSGHQTEASRSDRRSWPPFRPPNGG